MNRKVCGIRDYLGFLREREKMTYLKMARGGDGRLVRMLFVYVFGIAILVLPSFLRTQLAQPRAIRSLTPQLANMCLFKIRLS